jgi:hypothetical protein
LRSTNNMIGGADRRRTFHKLSYFALAANSGMTRS